MTISIKPPTIPTQSGVYIFKDKKGKPLYIGKAANLRARLKNYFTPRLADGRIKKMVASAARLDWQLTNSDIEALILESQLIKRLKPKFNIVMRDDKRYSYTIITDEEFPHIFISHQPDNFPGAKAIGPFTDAGALKTTLRFLRRVFPYCTCKQKHNVPCLNYHIGKCAGICCIKSISNYHPPAGGSTTKEDYHKNIKAITDILSGEKTALIKELGRQMEVRAKAGDLEGAIKLRAQLEKLERVFANAQIIKDNQYDLLSESTSPVNKLLNELRATLKLKKLPQRIEVYDISNIQGQHAVGVMVVFTNGEPDKNQYRKFKILRDQSLGDTGMLTEVLTRRFNHPEWPLPDLILVDGGKGQLGTAIKIAKINLPAGRQEINIVALTKNDKHVGNHIYTAQKGKPVLLKDLPPVVANFLLRLDAEAHRFAIAYYRSKHRGQYRPT